MKTMNWIRPLGILTLFSGLFWSCNVNEPETIKTLNLKLYDSLSYDRGLYDSVRVDIKNSKDSVVIGAIFHGQYLKSRDSATLANLPLGSNPPNPMKIEIIAYKAGKEALLVTIAVKDKQADNPIATVITTPIVPPVTHKDTIFPNRVILSESQLTLGNNGPVRRIYATLKPDSAVGGVTFTSSNRTVAEVDQDGNISPLDTGTALITAHVTGKPAIFDTMRVKVIIPPAISSITIQKPVAKLYVGAPATPLVVSHQPDNLALIPEFESSDIGIISVTGGAVKAVSAGQAIITVRPAGITGVQDTVHLNAVKDIPRIDAGIDQSVAVGQPVTFKVKVTQEYGSIALSWDFNDDQNPEGSVTTDSATATYTYNSAGDFNVVFTAKDGEGNTNTLTRRIRVGKAGPLILITKPKQDTLVRTPKFTVEYTADNVPGSQEFTLVEGLNNLRVGASNASGTDTVIVRVTLDTKPPVVKITSPAAGLMTNLPEVQVVWTVDLAEQATRNKDVLTGKQGLIWIVRDWTDSAGNRGADSIQITRDTIPPSAPTFVGVDTATNSPRPKWSWTRGTGGNGTFIFQLGTTAEVTTQDTFYTPITDLNDGNYTLRVRERDQANNLSPWVSRTITVKSTGPGAPTFSSTTTASPTNDKTPTWAWVSSGTIGGGSGTFRWSLNTPTPVSGEGIATQYTPMADLPDGNYTLTLQERDALGNWSTAITRDIRILTQGALVEITSPARRSYTNDRDGVISVAWSIDKVNQTAQPTHTLTTEGAWNLIRREYIDAAKNVSFDTLSVFWDTTTPKIAFATLRNGDIVNTQTIAVNWSIDGIAQTSNITETLSVGDGLKTVTRSFTDLAGNVGTASVQVTLDMTAPSAPTPTASSPTSDPTPTWTWSGTGPFEYRILNGGNPTGTGTAISATSYTPATNLAEGVWYFQVRERDAAGNWSAWSASSVVTIDITAPSAPSPTATSPTLDQTPTWTWSGTGPFEYRILNGGNPTGTGTAISATSYTPAANLAEGVWYFQVRERDAVGNWSAWSASSVVTIDITAPSAPNPTATSPTRDQTPTWTWSGTGPFEYRLSSGGNPTGSGTATTSVTFTPTNNLTEGTWYFQVRERDAAGNWSAWSASSIVVIDITAPDITNVSIPNNFVTNRTTIRIDYRVDGTGTFSNCALSINGTSANTCPLTASDALGNSRTVNVLVWRRSNVVFVRDGASGSGTSFDDAYGSLRQAVSSIQAGQNQIWMMEGTYQITGTPGPYLTSGMSIYGGFSSNRNQGSISDRSLSVDHTVLNAVGSEEDGGNPREIMNIRNDDGSTIRDVTLDGLRMTAGYYGLMIWNGENIVINNSEFTGSWAEPIISIENSTVTFNDCSFKDNTGGIMTILGNSVTINRCSFGNNNTSAAAFYLGLGKVIVNNSTFQNSNGFSGFQYWIVVDINSSTPVLEMYNNTIQGYGATPGPIVTNNFDRFYFTGSGNRAP